MAVGLPVSRLINATVNLAPLGAQFFNLNSLLILGDSDVIDTQTRLQLYGTLAQVASDFGTSAPEYLAASLYFAQTPQPNQLYIGRWAKVATNGRLFGAILTAAQQAITNFTAVTSGGFRITANGGSTINVAGINLSGVTNLNGVATAINTALSAATVPATVSWTGYQFVVKSTTTGTTSKIVPLTAPTSGTDISGLLGLTAAALAREVDGVSAETALQAVTALDALATSWYGLMFAVPVGDVADADHLAVAGYIEGSGTPHVYGLTAQSTALLDPTQSGDIASALMALSYKRTFVQYSSLNPYAVASFFGRALTTDFNANNSVITLMYKQEPGVVAETLNSAQASTLEAKRANVFVNYNNGTAIIEDGVMSGQAYFDEIYGLDWLQNRIQTDVYNLLYTSLTKIPQTDAGTHLIVTTIEAACAAGVTNGLLAPGVWGSGGFGQLAQGDQLPKGFYVYAPPVATQAAPDRAARKSVSIQIAAKLAGAIHSANVLINVNR